MANPRYCLECGAPLPPASRGGLCSVCALRGALEVHAVGSPEPPPGPPARPTATATVGVPPREGPGTLIGRYKILELLGEGGFGAVYVAEQREPVKRRVALKIIKPGMDSRQVIGRFEAERQALALMDHPNIAKVLDAGATENGRPFFVMELVKGIPITQYCDQEKLPTPRRLDLFIKVCQAIQHAHQKGIIHRDIKPSNILVTLHDGVPVPKVIDFGIAKATQQELTEKTVYTQFQQFIGTPAYMSPEQAEMSGLDIDTRSDIYSLGVLLYELLTGSTPFDAKELLASGLEEMRKIIREREPVRPSTRLRQTAAIRTSRPELSAIPYPLSTDLDWIVMKCLEKDRTRRYDTANAVALDIERHQKHEPVEARPPSTAYRLAKFVRRNQLVVTAGSAVVAALVIGLGLSTYLFFQEQQARRRAVAAERTQSQLRQQAEASATKAQTEARKSKQIAQVLKNLLKRVGPSAARGRDTAMVNEILDKTAESVGTEFRDSPETEAELRTALGDIYTSVYQPAKAAEMHRGALALNRRLYGNMSTNVADSLQKLGEAMDGPGEKERLYLEALTIRTNLLGTEHIQVANALRGLGEVRMGTGRIEEAEKLFRQAWAMEQRLGSTNSDDAARCIGRLSQLLLGQGKARDAEAPARLSLAIMERLGGEGEHEQHLGWVRKNLGEILMTLGKLDEAETNYRSAVTIERKLLGPDSPQLINMTVELAWLCHLEGKLDEAVQIARDALTNSLKLPDAEIRQGCVNMCQLNLGVFLAKQGNLAEAEPLLRQSITDAARLYPPSGFAGWRECVYVWFDVLRRQGKPAEAYAAISGLSRSELLDPSVKQGLLEIHADLSGRGGKWKEAAADYTKLIEMTPTNHWFFHKVAPVLLITGDLEAYSRLRRQILARFSSAKEPHVAERMALDCLLLAPAEADLPTLGQLAALATAATSDPLLPYYQATRGLAEYRQGRFADAVQWAQKALARAGEAPERDARAYPVLAMAQHQLKHAAEARTALAKAVELLETRLPHLDSGDLGGEWDDVLRDYILLRQAEALIEGRTFSPSELNQPAAKPGTAEGNLP